jgi:hypothetical protein
MIPDRKAKVPDTPHPLVPETCLDRFVDFKGLTREFLEKE